jgi:CheY-like chemotaxis protein
MNTALKKYTALTLDPDTCLKRDLEKAHISNVTLCPTASAEELFASAGEKSADLVLLHFELGEQMNGLELLSELRKQRPNMPALLLTPHFSDEQFKLAAHSRWVELMETPITASKWDYYLTRLFQDRQPAPKALKVKHIEELRNDDSGRLDAKKVSDVFGLPVTTIASCIGKPRATVDKTPDSIAVQPGLHHFERLAGSLLAITGSMKGLKIWLNSPNTEFEGHTPQDVIKLGQIKMLADWMDDARLGSPD